uniref:Transmembrane protein 198 n=1 Tax=Apteryx owenii TaxID=8824 RepID=A0A8B9PGY1_APTOW
MLVRSVGLFTTGLLLGLLLATAALVAAEPLLRPQSLWVPAGSLLGLALLCALLALQWQKPLTVLSTAVFGAAVIVVCVDYFVETLALVLYVYDRLRLSLCPGRAVPSPGPAALALPARSGLPPFRSL